MIVYWGVNKDEHLPVEDPNIQSVASEILRARRKGHHLVVMEQNVCDALGKLPLSRQDLAMLNRLSEEYTQTGAAIEKLKPAINIINKFDGDVILHGGIFYVPLNVILNTKILDLPRFVVENEKRDGFLYSFALKVLARYPLAFEIIHGGGADISDVFQAQVMKNSIVVCAVDSDKYTPKVKSNEKLNAIVTIKNRLAWPLCFALSPNCREIENIIPPHILFQLPSGKCNNDNKILELILKNEVCIPSDAFWNYFDIKKGVVHGKIRKLDQESLLWLRTKFRGSGIEIFDVPSQEMGDIPDDYKYIGGYGERVVDQMLRETSLHRSLAEDLRTERCGAAFGDVFSKLEAIFSSTEEIVT